MRGKIYMHVPTNSAVVATRWFRSAECWLESSGSKYPYSGLCMTLLDEVACIAVLENVDIAARRLLRSMALCIDKEKHPTSSQTEGKVHTTEADDTIHQLTLDQDISICPVKKLSAADIPRPLYRCWELSHLQDWHSPVRWILKPGTQAKNSLVVEVLDRDPDMQG